MVLRRFQHCTGHITTGSWKGRGNQYIQFIRVLYCKLPTNGKQPPAFPLEAVPGIEPRPLRWEARVLPFCHCGPTQNCRCHKVNVYMHINFYTDYIVKCLWVEFLQIEKQSSQSEPERTVRMQTTTVVDLLQVFVFLIPANLTYMKSLWTHLMSKKSFCLVKYSPTSGKKVIQSSYNTLDKRTWWKSTTVAAILFFTQILHFVLTLIIRSHDLENIKSKVQLEGKSIEN